MKGSDHRVGGACRRGGFSLIELVVAITIVSVLAAVAIPTFLGLRDESVAREPLDALVEMVAEVKGRASLEGRAYEIVFDRDGFYAMPRAGLAEGREALRERFERLASPSDRAEIERQRVARADVVRDESDAAVLVEREQSEQLAGPQLALSYEPPFLVEYRGGEGLSMEVLFWGDGDWTVPDGEVVRRWVFQPDGLVHPVRVRFLADRAFFEAGFDPLTGETVGVRSEIGEGVGS